MSKNYFFFLFFLSFFLSFFDFFAMWASPPITAAGAPAVLSQQRESATRDPLGGLWLT